jgi:hypothetical protein
MCALFLEVAKNTKEDETGLRMSKPGDKNRKKE